MKGPEWLITNRKQSIKAWGYLWQHIKRLSSPIPEGRENAGSGPALNYKGTGLQRRLNSQLQQICYAKIRGRIGNNGTLRVSWGCSQDMGQDCSHLQVQLRCKDLLRSSHSWLLLQISGDSFPSSFLQLLEGLCISLHVSWLALQHSNQWWKKERGRERENTRQPVVLCPDFGSTTPSHLPFSIH